MNCNENQKDFQIKKDYINDCCTKWKTSQHLASKKVWNIWNIFLNQFVFSKSTDPTTTGKFK